MRATADAGHGTADQLPEILDQPAGAGEPAISLPLGYDPVPQAQPDVGPNVTYIPMARGFLHSLAILDWRSGYLVASRLSYTLEADFCVDALNHALT